MSRVGLVCSEPLRERMAGIGIRYLEMARALAGAGFEVVLVSPRPDGEATVSLAVPPGVDTRVFEPGMLGSQLAGCAAVVAQGQLANDVAIGLPHLPLAIDLFDPWLVENMHYSETLGYDPYRNDHASWVLQASAADFVLCSSEEQRLFYLGFLAALGRLNPERLAVDPRLDGLIGVAPFGQPAELPPPRRLLPARAGGERRILFGGLYDWYDPWPLLEALERLDRAARLDWRLFLVRNPNPGTPQRLLGEVEAWCRARGFQPGRVELLDWVPYERRYDLLREVDLLAATHRLSLETELSMRTRFLDALRVGCPVLTTAGGTISRRLRECGAGWVVPERDPRAVERALEEILVAGEQGAEEVRNRTARGRELAAEFTWSRALEPLVRFCTNPKRDPTKDQFAFRPATRAPDDSLGFRVRRRLRRVLGVDA